MLSAIFFVFLVMMVVGEVDGCPIADGWIIDDPCLDVVGGWK